uniref:hypothetical protein n=1 Tax=Scytothamnus australis TaxID=66621 RepID=UPI002E768327|nr:hypothetical protein V2495_pgp077 [Scytothamnus australis]WAM64732.1 hypothetical protein [Scytothamnus australis]
MINYWSHNQLHFESMNNKAAEKKIAVTKNKDNVMDETKNGDTEDSAPKKKDKEKLIKIKKGDISDIDALTGFGKPISGPYGNDSDYNSGAEIDLDIDSDIFSDGETLYDPGANLFPDSEEESMTNEGREENQTEELNDSDDKKNDEDYSQEIKGEKDKGTSQTREGEQDNLGREKELNTLYKRYKNTSTKSKYHKSLNQTKIFLITKGNWTSDGKFNRVVLPINNLDDLSDSICAKSIASRVGLFQMLSNNDLMRKTGFAMGRPGNRPFILEHALESEGPYFKEPEVPLEALNIETHGSEKNGLSIDEIIESIVNATITSTETNIVYELVEREEGVFALYQIDVGNFEYDHTFIDNTVFTNVGSYFTDPRDRANYKRGFKKQLANFTSINVSDIWYGEKKLKTPNEMTADILSFIHKNTTELSSKNIIPVFSSVEDAQDLLLSVLEELLEPYRQTRPIKGFVYTPDIEFFDCTNQDIPMTNTEYFDDSLTLLNKIFPTTKLERFKHFLVKYRVLKPSEFKNKNYHFNYYSMPFATPLSREIQEKATPPLALIADYTGPVTELSCDSEILTLSLASRTKIISMGLGDFLEFWNNHKSKNAEALFIPSAKEIKKGRLPGFAKKSKDKFYEYQKQFRNTKNKKIKYRYQIQSSFE